MTRINCVPVAELTTKHLAAEYFELPRVFKAAIKWDRAGRKSPIPPTYRMGKGHVTFFYDKLWFVVRRFDQLYAECQRRGRKVTPLPSLSLPTDLSNDWQPTPEAIAISRARISEKHAQGKGL